MRMVTRVTTKGQATIPAEVRKRLKLKAGDSVVFRFEGRRVVLSKADRLDPAFLKLQQQAFADWDTPEADEAFRDL
jgi:AbrB family looped-hinge helix DNA binding protein